MHLNTHKTGLTFGLVVAGAHLVWSIFVGLGWAQWWVNFILWAHMIQVQVVVAPFDWVATLTLLVITFLLAYVVGFVVASLWNKLHKV